MHAVDLEHPEYQRKKAGWSRYRLLYKGGEDFRAQATDYLVRRHKEPAQVYGERVERVFYENYIGSIIDWYAATLFRREPVLSFDGPNKSGRDFFSEFTEDCDLSGTGLSDFMRRVFVDALIFGQSFVLLDFPRTLTKPTTRAEEEALGAARAYLVPYSPERLINWASDGHGNLEWAVLRSHRLVQREDKAGRWAKETKWLRYDRRTFEVHLASDDREGGNPVMVDGGSHGLSKLARVPLFELSLSDGLFPMGRAAHVQIEHFNKSNALAWALTMGLFAQPVVYSDRDFNQAVGESYYIQLGPDDKFGWTEPEGKVFQIAATNLNRLKDEIYRVCYVIHQAGGVAASRYGQSGLSKQRDYAITQEVLRAYGDLLKDFIRRILKTLNTAREDGLRIDVSGMDEFDIGDLSGEIADAKELLGLGIESKTFRTQVLKRLAMKYLSDVRADIKDQVSKELDEQFGS